MAPKLCKPLWKGTRCLKKPSASTSYARLHIWGKGAIWALSVVHVPREKIAEIVAKTDGEPPSLRVIDEVIAHKKGTSRLEGRAGEQWRQARSFGCRREKATDTFGIQEAWLAQGDTSVLQEAFAVLEKSM